MDLFDRAPAPRKGIGGHQSAKAGTTTWLTPPHIIAALGGWESFDLDPCGFAGSPIRTARESYCLPQNGLRLPWYGRPYVNPPYTSGEIGAWLERTADHGQGTALIFARTETESFQAHVFGRATGLLWLAGRLHFHHADGRRADANAGAPSVLCAYSEADLDRLAACDLPGNLQPLRFARFLIVAAAPSTWREAVQAYLRDHPGAVSLSDLYRHFARSAKALGRPNWRAKVRQTLQRGPFERVAPGVWAAA